MFTSEIQNKNGPDPTSCLTDPAPPYYDRTTLRLHQPPPPPPPALSRQIHSLLNRLTPRTYVALLRSTSLEPFYTVSTGRSLFLRLLFAQALTEPSNLHLYVRLCGDVFAQARKGGKRDDFLRELLDQAQSFFEGYVEQSVGLMKLLGALYQENLVHQRLLLYLQQQLLGVTREVDDKRGNSFYPLERSVELWCILWAVIHVKARHEASTWVKDVQIQLKKLWESKHYSMRVGWMLEDLLD